MTKTIYKAEEWQGCSGKWYCEDPNMFGKGYDIWLIPSRILNMSIIDFLTLIKNEYKAEIFYKEDGSFVGWYWSKQADMRKYKNWINAQSRKSGKRF